MTKGRAEPDPDELKESKVDPRAAGTEAAVLMVGIRS